MVITTHSFPCSHEYKYEAERYIDSQPYEVYRCRKCDSVDLVLVSD